MTGAPPNPMRLTLGEESERKPVEKQSNDSSLARAETRRPEPLAVQ